MTPVHQHRFAILYSMLAVLMICAAFAAIKVSQLKDSTHVIVKTNLGAQVESVGFDYLVNLGAQQGLKVSSYGIVSEKVSGDKAVIVYKLKTSAGDLKVRVTFVRSIWSPNGAEGVK